MIGIQFSVYEAMKRALLQEAPPAFAPKKLPSSPKTAATKAKAKANAK